MSGTLVGVKYSKLTQLKVAKWFELLKIPNPVDVATLHSTLAYSKETLAMPYGRRPVDWKARSKHYFSVFANRQSEGKHALVLEIDCHEMITRHHYIRHAYNAPWDFPDFRPHVTLSYDVPAGFSVDFHPDLELEIIEEYTVPLADNWTGQNKRASQRE